MENNIFKVLHAYHPNEESRFEKADVLVYQDALILAGYEKIGEPMSSFLHYQFYDLKLPNIYSTQLQMAEDSVPSGYKTADMVNVFHCESDFVLIPLDQMKNVKGYDVFAEQYSEPAEKLLVDDLDVVGAREYYNYPFRVYNDMYFAFNNAKFYSVHRPQYEVLRKKSLGRDLLYVSIKSKHVEIICFRNGMLTLDNSYKAETPEDVVNAMDNATQRLEIDRDSADIVATCIRKEEKDAYFNTIKGSYPKVNEGTEEAFGFPLDFWEIYGDLILCS